MQKSKSHSNNFLTLYGVFVFFLVGLFPYQLSAQFNLVPNPSFEQYTYCPSAATIYDYLNSKPDIWYKPDGRGGGYLNACAGDSAPTGMPYHQTSIGYDYQYARTGVAYIGMFYMNGPGTNLRNYFQVKLLDSLWVGKCYYAECYVNRLGTHKNACNNQSILFTNIPVYSDTSPPQKDILLANPQVTNFNNGLIKDTLNWIKVSGIFTAQGGEQYLTLGNFKDDNHTNYTQVQATGYNGAGYYVDDVSLYALDSMPLKADAGVDTTIATGDSAFVGSLTNGIPNITWYNSSGTVIKTGVPGFYVTPTTTTWYVIEQTVCGYASRDTVTVHVNPLPLHWLVFTALTSPQPLSQGEGQTQRGVSVTLQWATANEENVSHFNVQRSVPGREFVNIGEVKANNRSYNEYSFIAPPPPEGGSEKLFFRIQSIDKDGMRSYSPVRSVTLNAQVQRLTIYPNPASDKIHIEYNNLKQITITDAMGRVVLNKQAAGNKTTLTVNGLPKGLYLLRVMNEENNSETSKLMIE